MKRFLFIAICFLGTFVSCKEERNVTGTLDIVEDYVLPQKGASTAANEFILNIYKTYGSYFLYDYTSEDALWNITSTSGVTTSMIVKGDPLYVEPMLNLLNDVWLRYFPEEFLKKGGIPYRVYLADSLYDVMTNGRKTLYTYKASGSSLIVTGLNEKLLTINDAEKKKAWKDAFIDAMWRYYVSVGVLEIPNDFYEGTDYTTTPEEPLSEQENLLKYRQRGFLPRNYNAFSGDPNEWYSKWTWTSAKSNDLNSYMYHLFSRTDEEMEEYLSNPDYVLIQKKWFILLDYFKDCCNVDPRKVANAKFE
ncbi:hypothetical protein AALK14_19710 [Butyricimonas hominis]|uniref:hypothetical protein n=1 Tax=Butyricimonas hominis TaxID=2763032 RepID=UPI00351386D8